MLAPVLAALSALTTTAESVAALVLAVVVVVEVSGVLLNTVRSLGKGSKH